MLDGLELGRLYVSMQKWSRVHVFGYVVMLMDIFWSERDIYATSGSYELLMCLFWYICAYKCIWIASRYRDINERRFKWIILTYLRAFPSVFPLVRMVGRSGFKFIIKIGDFSVKKWVSAKPGSIRPLRRSFRFF